MSNPYNAIVYSDAEIKQAFAHCFITPEGKILLSYLRKITLERTLGPDATDSELHYLEGQRHLVKLIETLMSC